MQQAIRIKITPHTPATTERVGAPESCRHMNENARRNDITLHPQHSHKTWFKPADETTHAHISDAYGKLNMIAAVSRPSQGCAFFSKKFFWEKALWCQIKNNLSNTNYQPDEGWVRCISSDSGELR